MNPRNRACLVSFLSCVTVVAVVVGVPSAAAGATEIVVVQTHAAPDPHLDDDVLQEINLLRTDPAAYAAHLDVWRARFTDTLMTRPAGLPIRTSEGVAPVLEAIAVLRATPPLPPLSPSTALALAARDHVRDQAATGAVGHRGSDGSTSFHRISRHGRSAGRSAEVIDYGWSSARDIVLDLLVDDGVADRSHRTHLLMARYALAGAACGPHARYGVMCVVEVAESFAPRAVAP